MRKRSVEIEGNKTSISIEEAFDAELVKIAARRSMAISALIAEIRKANPGNLSSAVRVFILRDALAMPRIFEGSAS